MFLLVAGIVLLSLLIVLLGFAKYMGFLEPIIVKSIVIEPSTIIYTVFVGNYRDLMPTINGVKDDMHKYCHPSSEPFSLADSPDQLLTMGVYYDNPETIRDPSRCRAIVGVSLSPNLSKEKVDEILETLNEFSAFTYQSAKIDKPLNAFGAVFPLINIVSIFWGIIRGYPLIKSYGQTHNLLSKTLYSVEMYDRHNKKLTICFPYGDNIEILDVSGLPKPTYKNSELKSE